jgi:hypothetical protein
MIILATMLAKLGMFTFATVDTRVAMVAFGTTVYYG